MPLISVPFFKRVFQVELLPEQMVGSPENHVGVPDCNPYSALKSTFKPRHLGVTKPLAALKRGYIQGEAMLFKNMEEVG